MTESLPGQGWALAIMEFHMSISLSALESILMKFTEGLVMSSICLASRLPLEDHRHSEPLMEVITSLFSTLEK